MPSFKKVREMLLICHRDYLISDEEFLLLRDANTSDNLDFPHELYPEFSLDDMEADECKAEFRFEKSDIRPLLDVLQIPPFKTSQGSICNRLECLCMLLKRLAYPCRYSDMVPRLLNLFLKYAC